MFCPSCGKEIISGKYSSRSADFALQEHSVLRAEILTLVSEQWSVERNVLAAIGIVWGCLSIHPPTGKERWIWWVPVLFVIMGASRYLWIQERFRWFSQYLQQTEEAFHDPAGCVAGNTFWLAGGAHSSVTPFSTISL